MMFLIEFIEKLMFKRWEKKFFKEPVHSHKLTWRAVKTNGDTGYV